MSVKSQKACEFLGYHNVSAAVNGKRKTCGGLTWKKRRDETSKNYDANASF